jgi:hypothetical protein
MKLYVIVFIDCVKDGFVVTKDHYETLEEARDNMERCALEYVRFDGGERQTKITFQNDKTLDGIKNDYTLGPGLYLKNMEHTIHVYEKSSSDTGIVLSNITCSLQKKCVISVTSLDIEKTKKPNNDESFKPPKDNEWSLADQTSSTTMYNSNKKSFIKLDKTSFMNELSDVVLKGNGFGLKPI